MQLGAVEGEHHHSRRLRRRSSSRWMGISTTRGVARLMHRAIGAWSGQVTPCYGSRCRWSSAIWIVLWRWSGGRSSAGSAWACLPGR